VRIPFSSLFILLIFISCAKQPLSQKWNPGKSLELKGRIEKQNKKIHSCAAVGTMTIETKMLKQQWGIQLFIKKPDTLMLKIKAPFGVSIGSLLIKGEQVTIYRYDKNLRYDGDLKTLFKQSPDYLKFFYKDIFNFFCGRPSLPEFVEFRGMPDENDILHAEGRNAGMNWHYRISPEEESIASIDASNNGEVMLNYTADNFTKTNGVYVPVFWRAVRHGEKQAVSINYRKMKVNPGKLPLFKLRIPESAGRRMLDELY